MNQDYQPKYDFEAWRRQIDANLQNELREAMVWERAEKFKVKRDVRQEEDEIRGSGDTTKTIEQRLKDVQTVAKFRLESIDFEFRAKTKEAVARYNKENKLWESERKVDKTASEITEADINKVIQEVEKEVGAKSDREIESELNAREQKWKEGGKQN